MVADVSIHVLGTSRAGAYAAVAAALTPYAAIRHWHSCVRPSSIRDDDIVVIDLPDLPPHTTVQSVLPSIERGKFVVVTAGSAVDESWLELSSRCALRVIRCRGCGHATRCAALVAALAGAVCKPGFDELANEVVERERRLASAVELVTAVCRDPWRVRRPQDLARVTGMTLSRLRRMTRALGFARGEHLIVTVRLAMLDILVRTEGLHWGQAGRLAGVLDRTNFRRQIKRALLHSSSA